MPLHCFNAAATTIVSSCIMHRHGSGPIPAVNMGKDSKKIVAGTQATSVSAEKDHVGQEHLKEEKWNTMSMEGGQKVTGNSANTGIVNQYFEKIFTTLYGELDPESRTRALWLGGTLFFIVGGYWLLRSLKDPVLATICGVEYIPKAKILSLFVVTGFVTVYNKLIGE